MDSSLKHEVLKFDVHVHVHVHVLMYDLKTDL
jgi:hypothetical protein